MKENTIIVITGYPCTGKTSIAKELANKLGLILLYKDEIKEAMMDNLAPNTWSIEESQKIGIATYKLLYTILEKFLKQRVPFIVESNFNPKYDNQKFQDYQKRYGINIVQILCKTPKEILLERFAERSISKERHPGHCDRLHFDEFSHSLPENGRLNPLKIQGLLIEIDTSNFNKIDLDSIIQEIKRA